MQVFKAFLKVLNKQKGQMIMYIAIFAGVLGTITMSSDTKKESGYTSDKVKYAVIDYDNSEISKELTEYLSKTGDRKELSDDDDGLIKDEIYNERVECVLRIRKGFSDELKKSDISNVKEYLEVITIPDSMAGKCFETELESFISMYHSYSLAGFSEQESVDRAVEALKKEVSVSLPDGKEMVEASKISMYFKYLGWVLIMMCVMGITPVLQVFMKKELKDRIKSSSYKFSNMSGEILLGVAVTGLFISLAIVVIAFSFFKTEIFSIKCGLLIINMVCYMLVAMSLAFLISRCTTNSEVLSLLANILGLGMSFLCGVFVPIELLSEGIVKFAHFFPAYWYVMAVREIDLNVLSGIESVVKYCGIQLLFALAIIVIGLIIERRVKAK